jgi:hypothetical protein
MEVKRQPARVLIWNRQDCHNVIDAVAHAQNLLTREINEYIVKDDKAMVEHLSNYRQTLMSLYSAATEI